MSKEEATRFVNANIGRFPQPQYCKRVFRTFPDAAFPGDVSSEAAVNTSPVRYFIYSVLFFFCSLFFGFFSMIL